MAIEFRVLGDVEVAIDGRPVNVGHARQRCVLAVLLVAANQVVAVEELLDRVWADRTPQRARVVLSGYVSRLRQLLSAAPDVSLARRSGGYLLTVDPTAVDLHRFRRLISQARSTTGGEAAAGLFAEALGLWRGEAFGTLDTPWLSGVRAGLDAERHAAQLDHADLALAAGRHAELVGELSSRAAGNPLDERLAGQLMTALYRCGRQADALHHYQQLRERLVDELGADPGPALQVLHKQILTADPTLNPTSAQAGPSVVPRQLPPPPRSFAGRVRELAALDAVVDAAGAVPATVLITAVSGTAGVGKTALAVHWAHRVVDRFDDGQLYVNLRGFDPGGSMMTPAEAVRGFLDGLGVPAQRIPASPDAQIGLYRSLLAGRRMLVVLDNARDADQVHPLLPGTPGCLVMVTSRNQLTGLLTADGAHPLTLDLLPVAEARELLAHRLGVDRVAGEPDPVDDIITRCARLPLALAIVAARAASHPEFPLRALAAELADARGSLDTLAGGDTASDARAVFSWSYRTLSDQAARLFRLLGLHPGPELSTPAAASLAGLPVTRVRPLLAELTRAHLIIEHRPGRYTLHDLLRAYATEQAHHTDGDADRRQALHRALDHYLHTAYAAHLQLAGSEWDPFSLAPEQPGVTPERHADYGQALAWFTTEHRVLLAAVDHAAGEGFDTHTCQLAWTLWNFLDRRGQWLELVVALRAALAAAYRLEDPTMQARIHCGLGHPYAQLGRFDDAQAHLRRALDLYRRAGDSVRQAHTHLRFAKMSEVRGRHSEALDHTQQAHELYRVAGNRHGQAHALNGIGWYQAHLGDHQQALTTCQQALALLEELDDRYGQAGTWHSLGYAHHHLGDHTQAVSSYQHALALFHEVGARYLEADTLIHLADAHLATGNPAAARDGWQHALPMLDELDHPEADQVRAKLREVLIDLRRGVAR